MEIATTATATTIIARRNENDDDDADFVFLPDVVAVVVVFLLAVLTFCSISIAIVSPALRYSLDFYIDSILSLSLSLSLAFPVSSLRAIQTGRLKVGCCVARFSFPILYRGGHPEPPQLRHRAVDSTDGCRTVRATIQCFCHISLHADDLLDSSFCRPLILRCTARFRMIGNLETMHD